MGRLGILAPFPFWHLLDLSSLASYMQVLPLAWSHVPNLGPGHLTAGLPLPFLLTIPASCISTLQSVKYSPTHVIFIPCHSVQVALLFKNPSAISHPYFFHLCLSVPQWPKPVICSSLTNLSIQVGVLTNSTENMHWEKSALLQLKNKCQSSWDSVMWENKYPKAIC